MDIHTATETAYKNGYNDGKREALARKTGTWIGKHGYAQCSVCGVWQSYIYDFENWQNYCGHCGAEMTNLKPASRKNDPIQDKILWFLLNAAARRISRKYRGADLESHVFAGGTLFVYEIRVQKGREY